MCPHILERHTKICRGETMTEFCFSKELGGRPDGLVGKVRALNDRVVGSISTCASELWPPQLD